MEKNFKQHIFYKEDDIKINFYSEIVSPILKLVNPMLANAFLSEDTLLSGGRTDAAFQNVCFEYKKYNYFKNKSGINEALFGRDQSDHGLYDYIISRAPFSTNDSEEKKVGAILKGVGVGFDGCKFIFARFIPSSQKNDVNTSKLKL